MSRADVVRIGWGALLLAAPRSVLRAARAPDEGERSVRIARLLGSRQLAQGTVLVIAGRRPLRRLGRLADALHAASGLALALASPRWRSTAVADSVLATAFASTGRSRCMDGIPAGRQQRVGTISGGDA